MLSFVSAIGLNAKELSIDIFKNRSVALWLCSFWFRALYAFIQKTIGKVPIVFHLLKKHFRPMLNKPFTLKMQRELDPFHWQPRGLFPNLYARKLGCFSSCSNVSLCPSYGISRAEWEVCNGSIPVKERGWMSFCCMSKRAKKPPAAGGKGGNLLVAGERMG